MTYSYLISGGNGVQETGTAEHSISGGNGVQETISGASGVTGTIAVVEVGDSAVIAGNTQTRMVSLVLVASPSDATPQANLSGLHYAFYTAMPWTGVAPALSGSNGTTDAAGVFTLDLTGLSVNNGDVGYLLVTDSDGTTANDPHAFAAPIAVTVQ